MVQTHISTVFLADEVVYKLKKPVRFSFLDYSTLALRQHYCQEEVRLNRRLAPTVYLGVVPVWQQADRYWVGEDRPAQQKPDAAVIDYMVKMRRLPGQQTLGALLAVGHITQENIQAVSQRLCSFHATASTDLAARYGTPEVIWQALADNFQESLPFSGQTINNKQFSAIKTFSQDFLDSNQPLFLDRIRTGRVREGHGDLRCDHVYFLDDGITIVDCIEFSPRLRTCDVASELAFLAMDLELHGAPDLATQLVQTYSAQTHDEELLNLLPFYQCYRAYVRGKVASLKSAEPEVPAHEQAQARVHAQQAFRLAARYARGKQSPALLIVCGRIGTGKSTVSQLLSEHTGFRVFNSDVIRKRLVGIEPTTRGNAAYEAGIYTEQLSQQTYAQLRAHAEEQLRAGQGVIIDATCKNLHERHAFLELGARIGVSVFFLECQARAAEVERRLQEREQRGDAVSDATWAIARQAWDDFPAFDDIAGHHIIDTEDRLEDRLVEIVDRLA
jgi:aminoglycoside phosphotransferase family enzyme/predicted kinase